MFNSKDAKYWEEVYSEKPPQTNVHVSSEWYDKYYEEVRLHIKNKGSVIDAGCGDGNILVRLSKDHTNVYGIDFSKILLDKARTAIREKGCNNVSVFEGNILDAKKFIGDGKKVDSVLSTGVIQYMTHSQVSDFVKMCSEIISGSGEIVLLNIPNVSLKDLYLIRFFKRTEAISFKEIVKEVAKFRLTILKEKAKNPRYKYNDSIGNWYSMKEIEEIGARCNLKADFTYSMYPPLGYRFNARLTRK